ncbi:MAG: glycosyltransferase [Bacteroidales bacterium]
MKVLHTISGLNCSSGGPTACTYNLLKGLRCAGVEADVLTIKPRNQADKIVGSDNFIIAVDNDATTPFVYSRNFREYIETYNNYDIYHANGLWTYPTHITAKTARKAGKPYVIAPHGMLYPEGLISKPWKKRLALALFQKNDLDRATVLQATCRQEAEYIAALGFRNHIAIVPNSLPTDNIMPVRKEENQIRRFGFVGRIHPIKNIDVLLAAWAKLGIKTKGCELVIVGDGDTEYKKSLIDFTVHKKLDNVRFAGFLTGESLTETVRSFDYQLLVSKSENFGLVVPEALVNGIPCLATECTPWEELNGYRCGWWIKNGEENLAETIATAIELSEAERREMGSRGRAMIISNYSVEAVVEKIKRLYEWIAEGGKKPDFIY